MKAILKYRLEITEHQVIEMHESTIVHFGVDPRGDLCLWTLTDTNWPKIKREFWIFGTGAEITTSVPWRDSVIMGQFVWHIFSP